MIDSSQAKVREKIPGEGLHTLVLNVPSHNNTSHT